MVADARIARSWRTTLFGVLAALLASALFAPAFAQRPDDSYKGPSGGGGLDAQLREFQGGSSGPPGGAGGGLSGGSGAGGLQGRQTQGTIAPIPIAIPYSWAPTRSSPPTSPKSSRPTSATRVFSSRSTAAPSSSRCAM